MGIHQLKYLALTCFTFVAVLVLGLVAVAAPLSPWDYPIDSLSRWLFTFDSVQNRYFDSRRFCGRDCANLYLLTAEFFLVLLLFYGAVLVYAVFFGKSRLPIAPDFKQSSKNNQKALSLLVGISCLLCGMIWVLLFSGMADTSIGGSTNSNYSMFGLMLIFQVDVWFHFLILCLMAFVVILQN